jgi:RNA recognition motif-containing protein
MNRTLYVSHSGHLMDLSEIEELFTTVGDVEAVNLVANPQTLRAAQTGVIKMSTEQQAIDCLERFNGYNINGQILSVDIERAKQAVRVEVQTPRKKGAK